MPMVAPAAPLAHLSRRRRLSIFSINADLFEPRERARCQSFSSLVLMASCSIGPTLGGVMSQYFGWRSIFLVNLPVGILVLSGIFLLLPYVRPNRQARLHPLRVFKDMY